MKVVSIVIFSLLAVFVTWLVVDTVIYIIKRVKEKKKQKVDNETIDNQ